MTLPISRDKTYGGTTDHVNPSHVTHWQDILRMLWRRQHGSAIVRLAAFHSQRDAKWDMDKSVHGHVRHASSGTAVLAMPLVFPAGTRPTSVTVGWDPASVAAGLVATLRGLSLADGSLSDYGTVTSNSTAYHTRTFTPTLSVVASDEAYFLEVVSTDQFSTVAGAAITFRRLGRTTAP